MHIVIESLIIADSILLSESKVLPMSSWESQASVSSKNGLIYLI